LNTTPVLFAVFPTTCKYELMNGHQISSASMFFAVFPTTLVFGTARRYIHTVSVGFALPHRTFIMALPPLAIFRKSPRLITGAIGPAIDAFLGPRHRLVWFRICVPDRAARLFSTCCHLPATNALVAPGPHTNNTTINPLNNFGISLSPQKKPPSLIPGSLFVVGCTCQLATKMVVALA